MKRNLRHWGGALAATVFMSWQASAQITSFPHNEDFESTNACSAGSCNTSCSFTNGWSNDNTDNGEWQTDAGGTSSSSTGPSVDYNPGSSSGQYVYFETSSPCFNATASLMTPTLDLSGVGGLNMVFAYHMYGQSMGTLAVDVSSDGGTTWVQNLWTLTGDQGDVWYVDTVNMTAFAGMNNVQVRFRGTAGNNFYSDMAIDDVTFYEPLPIDIGVTAFPSPGLPSCNLTGSMVEATIYNFGSNDITSFDVEWEVNGTPQTPVSWTGMLPSGADTTLLLSSSYNFTDGDVLQANTTNPNMTTETGGGANNDTLAITIQSGLIGTYSIGAGGDYSSFAGAVNALSTFGVCGNVVFEVMDGTYTEQMSIQEVGGMSSTSTVTFRGMNMDASLVTVTYAATGTADNYVLQLNGGDHFNFEHMTLMNSGASYGTAINVQGGAHFNHFSNLNVIGDQNVATTSTNMALITSFNGDLDTMNTFDSLDCRYGSYAMYWYGNNTTGLEQGNSITNSNFTDFYYRGLHLYYQNDIKIHNNVIVPGPNYTGSIYRMYMYYNNGAVELMGNHIAGMKYGYGVYMSNCTAPATNRGMFKNNMFSVGDTATTSTTYGLYFTNVSNFDIGNNSTYVWSAGTSSRAMYMTGGTGNDVYNNVFRNDGPGYGVYILGGIGMMDYNAFYTPDTANARVGYFGGDLNTFADWQNTTGFDMNGVYGDPMYTSFDDLHTCADVLLGSAGWMDPNLMMDFDGQPRGMMPDIGADEFLDLANYSLGSDTVLKCSTAVATLGGMEPTDDATYIWSTNQTTPTIDVTNAGSYTVLVTSNCGTAFEEVTVQNIPDAVADFSSQSSFLTSIFTNNSTGATSYVWDFGDGNTSTMENPIHVYGAPGSYNVTLTVTGPCGTDVFMDSFNASVVGLDEAEQNYLLNVYPNPNNGAFDIRLDLETAKDVIFTLVDVTGKEVWSARPGNVSGTYVQHVNLDAQARGIYMLQVQVGDHVSVEKVVLD